jgi:hypothetical protein
LKTGASLPKMRVRSCDPTFRGAWRGSGSSGFFGLSRLFGSTNEIDRTDPRTK